MLTAIPAGILIGLLASGIIIGELYLWSALGLIILKQLTSEGIELDRRYHNRRWHSDGVGKF